MNCSVCGTDLRNESQFCVRCGHPTTDACQKPGQHVQSQKSKAIPVAILVAATAVVLGGLLWLSLKPESPEVTDEEVQLQKMDDATRYNLSVAINRCDSSATSQLNFPNSREDISLPEWRLTPNGGFTVERDISARDKHGVPYRYHYNCVAMPDGHGGIGQVSAFLMPINR